MTTERRNGRALLKPLALVGVVGLLLAAAALAAALSRSDSVSASELVLISAPATLQVGDLVTDPEIIAIDGTTLAAPVPAIVTQTWLEPSGGPCYLPVPGTRAIASTATEGIFSPEVKSQSISFRTKFVLPEGFTNPSISFTATADDAVEVLLNGSNIGFIQDFGTDLCDPPSSFAFANSGAFTVGENTVELRLLNFNAPLPLSLSYRLVISFTPPQVIPVAIDIKPGSDPNSINAGSEGVIPVAILTTPTFDAATVNALSVKLEGAPVRLKGKSGNAGSLEDVDGDGDLDLVVQIMDWTLSAGSTTATLTGLTFSGTPIQGSDSVNVVP